MKYKVYPLTLANQIPVNEIQMECNPLLCSPPLVLPTILSYAHCQLIAYAPVGVVQVCSSGPTCLHLDIY